MTMNQALEFWLAVAVVVVLVLIAAFFNAARVAMAESSRTRLLAIGEAGDTRAQRVLGLIDQPEKVARAIVVCHLLALSLAVSLATFVFIRPQSMLAVTLGAVVIGVLFLVFAAVLPRAVALTRPEQSALLVGGMLSLVLKAFSPFEAIITFTERQIARLFPVPAGEEAAVQSAHDDLRDTIDLHHREGTVVTNDRNMLGGILDLAELQVTDVMVHRTKMETVDADASLADVLAAIIGSAHSRLPVWRASPENIVGVLHVRDLLREASGGGVAADRKVGDLAGPPWFVPDTTALNDQLAAFLKRKAHLALVVEEYGEVMGLVTLEDILEVIVGEITDEHDRADVAIRPRTDGSVLVDGSAPIRDVNRAMSWNLPDDEATTIAGLVIHEAQLIPESGQMFTFHGCRFEVLRKARNRIVAVKVTLIDGGDVAVGSRQ